MASPPSAAALAAILAPLTTVTRRVEIYESDGVTPWLKNPDGSTRAVNPTGGSVSVSMSRAERRTIDLTLPNLDGSLAHYPGGFWYDKVIKPYRGVKWAGGSYETKLGEFLIDRIDEESFPHVLSVSGRDFTKRLITSKFYNSTTFSAGLAVEQVIKTIAINGGITKFLLPNRPDLILGRDFVFDRDTTRWEAIAEIALAFGLEVYFNADGFLVLREQMDPLSSPIAFTFRTGPGGSIAKFNKSTTDSRIYNSVLVVGDSSDTTVSPVWAVARNTEPSSPTRIRIPGQIGGLEERVAPTITSSFITTTPQAQDVANKFLAIAALEEFNIDLESVVLSWLEAGDIIEFIDPKPNPGDPTRFLLPDFDIPMGLGTMSLTGKRVTIVGS